MFCSVHFFRVGLLPRALDGAAGQLHDEVDGHLGDHAHLPQGLQLHPPLRAQPPAADQRLPLPHGGIGTGPEGDDWLLRHQLPAQQWRPGRVCWTEGHRCIPPV